MHIYDIKVRFMRKIQIRDYEPTESELTISAQLDDGEDAKAAIAEAFKTLSEEVHKSLGLPKDTKLPARARGKVEADVQTSAPTPAPAEKTTAKKDEKKPAEKKPAAATDDIPDDSATATKTTTAASTSDIPDDSAPQTAAAETTTEMAPADLSKWIGEQVRSGKVTSQAITGLYPKFGISRFADLKPEKCGEAKAAVEELIAKNK